MVRDDGAGQIEPERRHLREDSPLVGNPGAEHVVECRDAIGGDDDQPVGALVDVPNLAATIRRTMRERRLEEGSRQQRVPRAGSWEGPARTPPPGRAALDE